MLQCLRYGFSRVFCLRRRGQIIPIKPSRLTLRQMTSEHFKGLADETIKSDSSEASVSRREIVKDTWRFIRQHLDPRFVKNEEQMMTMINNIQRILNFDSLRIGLLWLRNVCPRRYMTTIGTLVLYQCYCFYADQDEEIDERFPYALLCIASTYLGHAKLSGEEWRMIQSDIVFPDTHEGRERRRAFLDGIKAIEVKSLDASAKNIEKLLGKCQTPAARKFVKSGLVTEIVRRAPFLEGRITENSTRSGRWWAAFRKARTRTASVVAFSSTVVATMQNGIPIIETLMQQRIRSLAFSDGKNNENLLYSPRTLAIFMGLLGVHIIDNFMGADLEALYDPRHQTLAIMTRSRQRDKNAPALSYRLYKTERAIPIYTRNSRTTGRHDYDPTPSELRELVKRSLGKRNLPKGALVFNSRSDLFEAIAEKMHDRELGARLRENFDSDEAQVG